MADEVLPAHAGLVGVLTDVRRYLGWHRDVAGDELAAAEPGALGMQGPGPEVVVTVEGASEPPRVVAYAEVPEGGPESTSATGRRQPFSGNRSRPERVDSPPVSPPSSAPSRASAAADRPPLDEVRRALGDCRRCKLCSGRKNIVFGVGNPGARLVFVGEGPGADEDTQGIPFVGAAGQLLTKMIQAMGLARDDVYICNVVKCRPPGNRNPEPDEITACQPFLEGQLKAIGPEVIVALGKFAAQTLLRTDTPITRLRGQWREYVGVPLMPTFHPAYLLRNPAEKKAAWTDLQAVMGKLQLPPRR